MKLAIIDRPDGADSRLLGDISGQLADLDIEVEVQRLQPNEVDSIDPDTSAVFVRAGYWSNAEVLLEVVPGLRWIQVAMTGVDHLPVERIMSAGVQLTNSRGVLDQAIAEFVLGSVLIWSKGLLRSTMDTRLHRTEYRESKSNAELKTLIIGTGSIGSACASALRAAGFGKIDGIRRTGSAHPDFDEVFIGADLREQVGCYEAVIACLPLTPLTDGLIGSSELSQLGTESVFVNVGRGATVDNRALAAQLDLRPESAAVLDVTEPEPLPIDHPLWSCPNVVISPHISGDTRARHDAFASLFLTNLRRFCTQSDLINLVNPSEF